MPSLHIRDIEEHTLEALRRRAKAHHRSVQGELRAILEDAANAAPPPEGFAPLRLNFVSTGRTNAWSREEIYGDEGR